MKIVDPELESKFKQQLEEMAAELSAAMNANTDSTAAVQLDTSIGRLSRMDAIQSQQMAMELKARQQQALLRVHNALDAIRKGAYGQCRRCKNAIAIERLEAQPDAVFCVVCAEKTARR